MKVSVDKIVVLNTHHGSVSKWVWLWVAGVSDLLQYLSRYAQTIEAAEGAQLQRQCAIQLIPTEGPVEGHVHFQSY